MAFIDSLTVGRKSLRIQSPARLFACLLIAAVFSVHSTRWGQLVNAQPPGTLPPSDLLRSEAPWSGPLKGIRPQAFLFQDESNTPVVMPRMSFEEIDRLRKRDRGLQSNEEYASLERLVIDGKVQLSRAELSAEILIRLDATAIGQTTSRSVPIDLGFAGSNLLQPAVIQWQGSGNPSEAGKSNLKDDAEEPEDEQPQDEEPEDDESASSELPDTAPEESTVNALSRAYVRMSSVGGYQLVLPTNIVEEKPTELISIRLSLSHRVERTSRGQASLPMNLPVVSTQMEMDFTETLTPSESASLASLDVKGTNREVVRRVAETDRFIIECSGGDLTLEWATPQPTAEDSSDLLEVESDSTVQWESPAEPLAMEVVLSTRNLRGPLTDFEVSLPTGAVLLSPPEMNSEVAVTTTINSTASQWAIEVNDSGPPTMPSLIRVRWIGDAASVPSSGQLRLKIRQVAGEANASAPWTLSVPQVVGAIGHSGVVTIQTSDDHRLRWRPRLGIDAVVNQQNSDKNGELSYPFRFSQNRFELPIWLSTKQEQLRITTNLEVTVTRKAAVVSMEISAGGSGIDPKDLRLELEGWRLLDIRAGVPGLNAESVAGASAPVLANSRGPELDVTVNDQVVQWQVDTSDGKWPENYLVTAELPSDGSLVSLTLPRLVSNDPVVIMSDVNLSLADGQRETWLVDLSASPLLQRVEDSKRSRFRLIAPESTWTIQGEFASQPLELQWTGTAELTQSSDQWRSLSSWMVTSSLDLEGRLRFSMPSLPVESSSAASVQGGAGELASEGSLRALDDLVDSSWTVRVNGASAVVRRVDSTGVRSTDGIHNGRNPQARLSSTSSGVAVFESRQEWEIISPELATGLHEIELSHRQPVLALPASKSTELGDLRPTDSGSVLSLLSFPTPLAERVTMTAPMRVEVPSGVVDANGLLWRVSPELDGLLGDLMNADKFEFDSLSAAVQSSATSASNPASNRAGRWSFKVLPDFPIPIVLRSRIGEEQQTEIPRSYLRSLIGKQVRHEHLLASVKNGRRVRLGLPSSLKTIRVEVRFDGQLISATRDSTGLRIDFPNTEPLGVQASGLGSELIVNNHLLDVRVWTEVEGNPWFSQIEPMIRLPLGSGLQYWQLIVPNDSHLVWASSQSGRAMRWQQERLRMERVASVSDPALIRWVTDSGFDLSQLGNLSAIPNSPEADAGSESTDRPANQLDSNQLTNQMIRESLSDSSLSVPGNRYLFFAGNSLSFSAATVSRTMLWLIVGGLVLVLAIGFDWFPSIHHPLVAFGLAIVVAGMMVVAPDGVVLAAQLAMISLSLVAVFYAISAIAVPRNRQRVLSSRNGRVNGTRTRAAGSPQTNGSGPATGSHSGVQRTSDWNRRADDRRLDNLAANEPPSKPFQPNEPKRLGAAGQRRELNDGEPTATPSPTPSPSGKSSSDDDLAAPSIGTTQEFASGGNPIESRDSDRRTMPHPGRGEESGSDLPGVPR